MAPRSKFLRTVMIASIAVLSVGASQASTLSFVVKNNTSADANDLHFQNNRGDFIFLGGMITKPFSADGVVSAGGSKLDFSFSELVDGSGGSVRVTIETDPHVTLEDLNNGENFVAWTFKDVEVGTADLHPIPVPSAILMLLSGLAALGYAGRRREPA